MEFHQLMPLAQRSAHKLQWPQTDPMPAGGFHVRVPSELLGTQAPNLPQYLPAQFPRSPMAPYHQTPRDLPWIQALSTLLVSDYSSCPRKLQWTQVVPITQAGNQRAHQIPGELLWLQTYLPEMPPAGSSCPSSLPAPCISGGTWGFCSPRPLPERPSNGDSRLTPVLLLLQHFCALMVGM